ncbi:hypothetical protein ACFWP3_21425 [Streptomyces sp. NPDC058525]|uniref:hypothetical protein n=1 Tax=unclassified Streptomyces TaxID=2593676 RepID=UPI0036699CD4
MTASDALLRRIEQNPSLAASLVCPGDFDIDRRDPIDDLVLFTGAPLHPIAGCGAGDTYYLWGEPGAEERPVLYADSEGRATLIGADLVEAVTLIVVLPFWRDVANGSRSASCDRSSAPTTPTSTPSATDSCTPSGSPPPPKRKLLPDC